MENISRRKMTMGLAALISGCGGNSDADGPVKSELATELPPGDQLSGFAGEPGPQIRELTLPSDYKPGDFISLEGIYPRNFLLISATNDFVVRNSTRYFISSNDIWLGPVVVTLKFYSECACVMLERVRIIPFSITNKVELKDGYLDSFYCKKNNRIKGYLSFCYNTYSGVVPTSGIAHVALVTNYAGKVIKELKISNVSTQQDSGAKPWENGVAWTESFELLIDDDFTSGLYFIDSKIFFVVPPTEGEYRDFNILVPTHTIAAYCSGGGKSVYGDYGVDSRGKTFFIADDDRLPLHSNRKGQRRTSNTLNPINDLSDDPLYYMRGFLDAIHTDHVNQYSFGYITDYQMEDLSAVNTAKCLIVPGHSEYWTKNARLNFDSYVESGKNAILLTGNTMFWQARIVGDHQLYINRGWRLDPMANSDLKSGNWQYDSVLSAYKPSASIGLFYSGDSRTGSKWAGLKIASSNSPFFTGLNFNFGDIIRTHSQEVDGIHYTSRDSRSVPISNYASGFYKYEVLAWSELNSSNSSSSSNNNSWAVVCCQKTSSSGFVFNVGSIHWCARYLQVGSEVVLQYSANSAHTVILSNALRISAQNISPFSAT